MSSLDVTWVVSQIAFAMLNPNPSQRRQGLEKQDVGGLLQLYDHMCTLPWLAIVLLALPCLLLFKLQLATGCVCVF